MRRQVRRSEEGISGLAEVGAIILAVGILTTAGLFTYRLAQNSGGDQQAQSNLNAALNAANDVYNDTQDYTTLSTTALTQQLESYDHGACFLQGTLSSGSTCTVGSDGAQSANVIAFSVGTLSSVNSSDTNPGGYIALATLSSSGTCWNVYVPADGQPVKWGTTSGSCAATPPVGSPTTTTTW